MKIEYNNLYTHFVFTTLNRMSLIWEKHRERIEKYITGIVNKMTKNEVMRSKFVCKTPATEVVLLRNLGRTAKPSPKVNKVLNIV
jgi:hypothetical protein